MSSKRIFMSLSNLLEKIQNKPRYIRIQILCLAVFVSMIFVFSLWVVSLKYSMPSSAEETVEESSQSLGEAEENLSLKEAFQASIGAFFGDDLEEALEEINNQEKEVEEIEKDSDKIKPVKLPLSP